MPAPTVPGTCCLTQAEDLLLATLAECQAVLDFLGAADKGEALAGNMYVDTIGRVAEEYDPAEWQAKFPHVLIGTPGDSAGSYLLTPVATGLSRATGQIEIMFAELVPLDEENDPDRMRVFKNKIGDIVDELIGKRQFDFGAISLDIYGANPEKQQEELGVIFSARFVVNWGTSEVSE